jgi:hypothetical protein
MQNSHDLLKPEIEDILNAGNSTMGSIPVMERDGESVDARAASHLLNLISSKRIELASTGAAEMAA